MTELEVTQNALDMFVSATATETWRALKAESDLRKLRTELKAIIVNNPNREEQGLTDAYAVLDDLLTLIGTFPNE